MSLKPLRLFWLRLWTRLKLSLLTLNVMGLDGSDNSDIQALLEEGPVLRASQRPGFTRISSISNQLAEAYDSLMKEIEESEAEA